MRFLTAIIAVVLCSQTFAQTIKKGKGQLNGLSYNYYYLKPAKDIRGIVILMGALARNHNLFLKGQAFRSCWQTWVLLP